MAEAIKDTVLVPGTNHRTRSHSETVSMVNPQPPVGEVTRERRYDARLSREPHRIFYVDPALRGTF